MNMREKIAKALAHCDGMHPDAVSNDEEELPIWTTYLDVADAVLDALMSPSANMIDEGIDADDNSFDGLTQVATIFTAMIQAAKEGK